MNNKLQIGDKVFIDTNFQYGMYEYYKELYSYEHLIDINEHLIENHEAGFFNGQYDTFPHILKAIPPFGYIEYIDEKRDTFVMSIFIDDMKVYMVDKIIHNLACKHIVIDKKYRRNKNINKLLEI